MICERTTGGMILNGFKLQEQELWQRELVSFWTLFRTVLPNHDIYDKDPEFWSRCIPFQYHGDEGRGKLRRQVLICSYAPALQSKGHSFLSRLLSTIVPGERYAVAEGDGETLECLRDQIAADLLKLVHEGLEVGLGYHTLHYDVLHFFAMLSMLVISCDDWFAGAQARR